MPRPREVHPLVRELAKLREASGLRQADVSRMLGYGSHTVSCWERGVRTPNLWDLCAYAKLLDRELILDALMKPLDTPTEAPTLRKLAERERRFRRA